MRKNDSKKSKGDLNRRLKIRPHPSYIVDTSEWDEWIVERHKMQMITMQNLLAFYEISDQDRNKWFKLAFKLGEQYVPAMQFQEKRGSKKYWSEKALFTLCLFVDQLMDNSKEPKKGAFSKIKKMAVGSCIEELVIDAKPKTLENKYYAFIKSDAYGLFRNLERAAQLNNRLADFHKAIIKEISPR